MTQPPPEQSGRHWPEAAETAIMPPITEDLAAGGFGPQQPGAYPSGGYPPHPGPGGYDPRVHQAAPYQYPHDQYPQDRYQQGGNQQDHYPQPDGYQQPRPYHHGPQEQAGPLPSGAYAQQPGPDPYRPGGPAAEGWAGPQAAQQAWQEPLPAAEPWPPRPAPAPQQAQAGPHRPDAEQGWPGAGQAWSGPAPTRQAPDPLGTAPDGGRWVEAADGSAPAGPFEAPGAPGPWAADQAAPTTHSPRGRRRRAPGGAPDDWPAAGTGTAAEPDQEADRPIMLSGDLFRDTPAESGPEYLDRSAPFPAGPTEARGGVPAVQPPAAGAFIPDGAAPPVPAFAGAAPAPAFPGAGPAPSGPAAGQGSAAPAARVDATSSAARRALGGSPIIDPGLQPAAITAGAALLLGLAAMGPRPLLAVVCAGLQVLTAAGWFRLNGMWPARQGIALAALGGLTANAALLAASGGSAGAALAGTLGGFFALVLVLQLARPADPAERFSALTVTASATALAVLAGGWSAAWSMHASGSVVTVGALAAGTAVLVAAGARLGPSPAMAAGFVAALVVGGAGGALTGLGAAGGLALGAATGACALVGRRVAAYDYPSRFVHLTAGVALPLALAAPAAYLLGLVAG